MTHGARIDVAFGRRSVNIDVAAAVKKNVRVDVEAKTGGGGRIKPGNALEFVDGVLNVVTADRVEQDNTLPVTSAAVHVEIGNIEALLAAL